MGAGRLESRGPARGQAARAANIMLPSCFNMLAPHMGSPANDQVHRARGPMGFTFEQSKSVNEGEGVEKPKDERSPVQRLVIRRLRLTYPLNIGSFTEFAV